MLNKSLILLVLYFVLANSKVYLFTRHGQRSPTSYSELNQIKWKAYKEGDLTEVGVNFLYSKFSRLIQTQGFDLYDQYGNCNPQKFEIVSSLSERTILSTLSIIKALCPINYQDISYLFIKEELEPHASVTEDLQYLLQSDFNDIFALSNYTRSFQRKQDYLFHGSDLDQCPALEPVFEQIYQSEMYKQLDKNFKSHPSFEQVLAYIKQENPQDAQEHPDKYTIENYAVKGIRKYHSNYLCNVEQGLEVPKLTLDQLSLTEDAHNILFYKVDNGDLDIQQAAVSEVFRWIISSLFDEEKKLHWYSGHDSNQVSILNVILDSEEIEVLGAKSLPPFGSDLQIEISIEKVNVYYNGLYLRTRFCTTGYNCEVKEMVKFFQQYIVEDIQEFCTLKTEN